MHRHDSDLTSLYYGPLMFPPPPWRASHHDRGSGWFLVLLLVASIAIGSLEKVGCLPWSAPPSASSSPPGWSLPSALSPQSSSFSRLGSADEAGAAYVVHAGDTLASIAARDLGAARRWQEVLACNPEITDPNMIRVGQVIRVGRGASCGRGKESG